MKAISLIGAVLVMAWAAAGCSNNGGNVPPKTVSDVMGHKEPPQVEAEIAAATAKYQAEKQAMMQKQLSAVHAPPAGAVKQAPGSAGNSGG
jgi:hypothetical protein